jgi:hypothetical protein
VLLIHLIGEGGPIASIPDEAGLSFPVPGPEFEATMWSA